MLRLINKSIMENFQDLTWISNYFHKQRKLVRLYLIIDNIAWKEILQIANLNKIQIQTLSIAKTSLHVLTWEIIAFNNIWRLSSYNLQTIIK